jgi:hypothetical protein
LVHRIGLVLLTGLIVGCAFEPGPSETSVAEAADALFETVATYKAEVAEHVVDVAYPAAWFSADDCTWFDPQPRADPDADVVDPPPAIQFGAVPSAPLQGREPTSGVVDGKPWIRTFESTREEDVLVRHLVYYITLDPLEGAPTMVAATSTSAPNDPELNAAVLDRIVERLDFPD